MSMACADLPEPRRSLCRGEIDLSEYLCRSGRPDHAEPGIVLPPSPFDANRLSIAICRHRGDPVGELQASASCGCDRRIFACDLHGQCVSLFRAASARRLIAEAGQRGLQNCCGCPDLRFE